MIKEMNGFKVISSATRTSCRMGWNKAWGVSYYLNKVATPKVKGTKLFFFKNREDAEIFAIAAGEKYKGDIIVPCIAKNVVKVKWVCRCYDLIGFWETRSKCHDKMLCPEGTYLAESITCLE
jgi:hypothetical protein